MATTYKQKLIGEINAVPENFLPRFYRIMHILRTELTRQATTTRARGSLKGIWSGARPGRPPEHGEGRRCLEDRPPRRLLP